MHFHLPIKQASRRLSLCPTVLKKICRRGGLNRWPHRRVKSLLSKFNSLKEVLRTATDPRVRMRAEQELARLEKRLSEICSGILRNYT
ncbi:hypothetical protein EUTSA_v10009656mg [Eutrema salsugineum]|uniref:RWP-RK domain-containing protein n=1 Tax=Eutrema salsugineum TaxID=72664 RepID=V4KWH4_EUTSA|nr:hypothetical protein EUTSA_v10009656mg [Eutrema salsugineum]